MHSLKFIKSEIYQFFIIGLCNTVVSWILFLILDLFMNYVLAYTFTFILCIASSYTLNSYFVFKQPLSLIRLFKYPIVFLIQYIIQAPSLIFLIEYLNVSKIFAIVFVTIITVPITFFISRFIIKPK